MNRRRVLMLGLAIPFGGSLVLAKDMGRPLDWAIPVAMADVPNLYRVGPHIYRSAQPTAAGFKALEQKLGVKTVLSLREFHSDVPLLAGRTLKLETVPMNAAHIETEDVLQALKIIVESSKDHPVLVHCQQGADRTGVVIAMYRVVVQGWDKERAIAELEQGGFGFHRFLLNIPAFIRHADVAAYRQSLAISP